MFHVPDQGRVTEGRYASTVADGNNGAFVRHEQGLWFWILASDGGGWEHVSVHVSYDRDSKRQRAPTWGEMCRMKDLYWDPEDVVMQLHPRASAYCNDHPCTLHLWRPIEQVIPEPPMSMVGFHVKGKR